MDDDCGRRPFPNGIKAAALCPRAMLAQRQKQIFLFMQRLGRSKQPFLPGCTSKRGGWGGSIRLSANITLSLCRTESLIGPRSHGKRSRGRCRLLEFEHDSAVLTLNGIWDECLVAAGARPRREQAGAVRVGPPLQSRAAHRLQAGVCRSSKKEQPALAYASANGWGCMADTVTEVHPLAMLIQTEGGARAP